MHESGKVFLADTAWHRVLYWEQIDTLLAGAAPDAVLGNTPGTATKPGVSRSTFTQPGYLAFDALNGRLFVGEFDWGSRLLVFDGGG